MKIRWIETKVRPRVCDTEACKEKESRKRKYMCYGTVQIYKHVPWNNRRIEEEEEEA